MELIPILSLIILVATISTFILAVGAYILYKIRERKGVTAKAAEPESIPGELVAPAPLLAEQRMTQTGERRTFTEERFPTRGETYIKETFVERAPTKERMPAGPDLRPTFISNPPSNASRISKADGPRITRVGGSGDAEQAPKRKFMRYTNESPGTPAKENKEEKKNEGLRWR